MAFLDQFNHRVATLLYRAWKKYRYPIGYRAGARDERSRDLLALAGFGIGDKPRHAGLPASRVLALLGLLNQRTRTAEGLTGAVALTVPGAQVEIEDFYPVWTKVADPMRLKPAGANLSGPNAHAPQRLNRSTVMGKRVLYRSKAVKITLRPKTPAQAQALFPGGQLHQDLMGMLRIYVGTKADVILRMRLRAADAPVLRLPSSQHSSRAPDVADSDDEGGDDETGRTRDDHPIRLTGTAVLKPKADRIVEISLGRYEAFAPPAATFAGAPFAGSME
jgi:type VI secretion system protein ImpH